MLTSLAGFILTKGSKGLAHVIPTIRWSSAGVDPENASAAAIKAKTDGSQNPSETLGGKRIEEEDNCPRGSRPPRVFAESCDSRVIQLDDGAPTREAGDGTRRPKEIPRGERSGPPLRSWRPHPLGGRARWLLPPRSSNQTELQMFLDLAPPRKLDISKEKNMDKLLTDYLNRMYLDGHQSYRADRLIAAILHRFPEFGRMGNQKLPHTWRAIRGYRKLTPGRTRQAFPLAVWAAFAVEMVRRGALRMALFLLVALSSYARPSELLRAKVCSLVRPANGITRTWSLLLAPEEEGLPTTKRGTSMCRSCWTVPGWQVGQTAYSTH